MNRRTLRSLTVLLFALASPLAAQEPPEGSATVAEYRAYLRAFGTKEQEKQLEDALDAKAAAEVEASTDAVEAQPTSITPPDGFSERVAGTITDFLPLFQFAVDSVTPSDDGKAVVVAFNPVQVARSWKLKLTATAAEPEPFERLLNEVPEAARAAVKESISSELGDFGDVTWAATLGIQPHDATGAKIPRWGRDSELYRSFARALAAGFGPKLNQVVSPEQIAARQKYAEFQEQIREAFKPREINSLDPLTFDEIRAKIEAGALPGFDSDAFLAALVAKERVLVELDQEFHAFQLDRLAPLIHNQPQFVLTASYRDRDELVGQKAFTATARVEWGTRNVNTVVRRFRELESTATMAAAPDNAFRAYREVVGGIDDPDPKTGWRGTASLTFQRLDELPLDVPFEGGSVSLTVPDVDEWCGKFQLSRFADWHEMTIDGEKVKPRLDLSFEVIEVDGDPKRQDRRVAKVTYDLPVAKGVTIPVTMVYANKAEFLGDPDEQFSTHVGLSYKLPDWGK
jgi:hypothetical protein